MKLAITAMVAAVLALVLPACGGEGGDGSEKQETTVAGPAALEASAWILSDGIDVADWEQAAPTINFEHGRFGGSSGCNAYGGNYKTDGSSLKLSKISSTAMGCAPPADEVEQAFMSSLEGASEWTIEDGELALSGGEDELRFEAASPEGSWSATSILQGDAVTTLIAGTEITAEITDGAISGSSGCNEYEGGFETAGAAIEVGPLSATEMGCGTSGETSQEVAYLEALPRAKRFRIENRNLVLLTAQDTIVATFEPAVAESD